MTARSFQRQSGCCETLRSRHVHSVRDVTFWVVDAASPATRWAMEQYFDEIDERFTSFDRAGALESAAVAFNASIGTFMIADRSGDVVGCGGVQFLDEQTAEIKWMWVSPTARGIGLGKRLLARLEHEAASAEAQHFATGA